MKFAHTNTRVDSGPSVNTFKKGDHVTVDDNVTDIYVVTAFTRAGRVKVSSANGNNRNVLMRQCSHTGGYEE